MTSILIFFGFIFLFFLVIKNRLLQNKSSSKVFLKEEKERKKEKKKKEKEMSQLSFGGWGGVSITTPSSDLNLNVIDLGVMVQSVKYELPCLAGPRQYTLSIANVTHSFIVESQHFTPCNFPTPRPSTRTAWTGKSRACTVVTTTPSSTRDLRTDCFQVTTTPSSHVFVFRFSPYEGVKPTIEFTSAASLADVTLIVDSGNAITSPLERRESTFTYTDAALSAFTPLAFNRVNGMHLLSILNPDSSVCILQLHGNAGNNPGVGGGVGVYSLPTPYKVFGIASIVFEPFSGSLTTLRLQIATTTGYIYNLVIPSQAYYSSYPTLTLNPSSSTVGNNDVSISVIYFLEK